MKKKDRPLQVKDLHEKICECIKNDKYTQTKHAIQRESERSIELPDALYVLINGRHEKSKTSFDEVFQTWKYAVRGFTLEGLDVRVIVAFDENNMMIITVMHII